MLGRRGLTTDWGRLFFLAILLACGAVPNEHQECRGIFDPRHVGYRRNDTFADGCVTDESRYRIAAFDGAESAQVHKSRSRLDSTGRG